MGAYAQAVIVHNKKSKPEKYVSEEEAKKRLGEELADIIGMAIINADLFGIDIQKSIKEKWLIKLYSGNCTGLAVYMDDWNTAILMAFVHY